jgi:hypothetical protein
MVNITESLYIVEQKKQHIVKLLNMLYIII